MHKVGAVYPSVYVVGLVILFTIHHNTIFADFINPISTENVFHKVSLDEGDDYEDNDNDNFGYIALDKRDVIKGPSFIPNIDPTTAETDIAYENDEVSEEGSRRLNIGTPYQSDLPRNIKPKHNIEDNLDAIETLMKDDSDSWVALRSHPLKAVSQFIHHKKPKSDSIIEEQASKKDLLSKIEQNDDDELPKKVIKALYDWKEGATTKGYRKSQILSNTSNIVSAITGSARSLKSPYSINQPGNEHLATRSESPEAVPRPYLTESNLKGVTQNDAELVVPAYTLTANTRNDITPLEKKRKKINVVVKLNINETPGRRSKVGSSRRRGPSFFTVSTESGTSQKRSHHLHRRRGHRRAKLLRKIIKEEDGSGEGSASGAGDVNAFYPSTYSKPVKSATSRQASSPAAVAQTQEKVVSISPVQTQDNTASASPTQDYTNYVSPTQDYSAAAAIPVTPTVTNTSYNEYTYAVNTNGQDATSAPVSQAYSKSSTDVKSKEDSGDIKPKERTESQYTYPSYNSDKSGDGDTESSGSGHGITYDKEVNTKELSYKAKIILGYSDTKNETDRSAKTASTKENENSEKEQSVVSENKESENQYVAKNTEAKDEGPEAETVTPVIEATTEQKEEKSENVERNESNDSNKDQQSTEVHKEETEQDDKSKSSNLTSQSSSNDEPMKEKAEETTISINTDGTDNMKKKSGQEDKYETLEEVREKFKKWESTIIKNPSGPSDEGNSAKLEDNDTEPKSDETVSSLAKSEESNTPSARTGENINVATKPEESNAPVTAKIEKTNAATKPDGISKGAIKSEESSKVIAKLSEPTPMKTTEEVSEKKNDDLGKGKVELFSAKKVNNMLLTEKGEAEEKTPEETVVERPTNDLVKELIGIPAKQTQKTGKTSVKGKDTVETTPSQDIKSEKNTSPEGGKLGKTKAVESKEEEKGPPVKLAVENKEEEKGPLVKVKVEDEVKFDIEEVSKKNKEHHDLPDSDMKQEVPEKVSLKAEDVSRLNSSNVPGVNEQPTGSEEKPIVETPATQETSSSQSQTPATEEKVQEKASTTATRVEERPVKPIQVKKEKHVTKADNVQVKHKKEQTRAEEKIMKPSAKVTKTVKQTAPEKPVTQTKDVNEFAQDQDKSMKKAASEEVEGSTEFTIDQEKTITNPQMAKEANEFSNEQENSFASAIEKIKAQEEKLKGKEISSEIEEIKGRKHVASESEPREESFGKENDEETMLVAKSKKHSYNADSKKPSEKNLKQLRLYKHQILSEVGKIDDLMSEYQKDGHSTKELSEAKDVLENDLKLVKELEKNTKKKTLSFRKEKERYREKQVMPSSAFLNTASDESNEDLTHRDKSNNIDSKSRAKALAKEAEKNEKQLANLIPSYEYYFHSEPKSPAKHQKKQSLEEIHKLLKAEIKRLRQKKNGKADNQLKNIRKLVQQHLKKLISSGDIDKTAFHSLAPEIKQLGELLKERIKSLKKKKQARKMKAKKFKASILVQNINNDNKKAIEKQPPALESPAPEVSKVDSTAHHNTEHPTATAEAPKVVDRLNPPLDNVKGLNTNDKPTSTHTTETQAPSPETSQLSPPNLAPVEKVATNETAAPATMPVISDNAKIDTAETSVDPAQNINIKNLLKTLNEKLGSVYQKAKDVHDIKLANSNSTPSVNPPETSQNQEPYPNQRSHSYENENTGVAAAVNQPYSAPKPIPASHAAAAAGNPSSGLHAGDQRQNVETVSNPPVVQTTETQTAPVAVAAEVPSQETPPAMPVAPNNAPAPMQAEATTETVDNSFQAAAQPVTIQPETTPQPILENKADLPMVPSEPEFEEDNTEALASLEPINTLVETLEKDITELWSYKDLYPNADALGLDNEKVHNTYANLGSLSGLSLRRALNRALRGEDVGLGVVGGSISKGGPFSEKGLEYVLRSYFYAIEDYWNKVIRPITGSSMIVRDVSLGGISTDYYSFCIRNHLPDDKLTNIVLWELSANDMRRYDDSLKPKPQPLEQFTRNILTYRAKPSLIFVNFFALFDWDPDLRANCRNFEDEGEDDVAKYYKITSLSWRNMVCPLLKTENNPIFTRNNLFAEDHFHPSILGHAQMSYIIIDYIRTEFLKNLVKMRPFFIGDAVEKLQIPRSIYMPRPMFKETFLWKPLCYTYMLVDNRLPNNTMPLHEENESDFKYTVVRGFKIRSDKIAGMETKLKDQFIRYKLQIPRHEDGNLTPFKQLGIMSFTDDRYAEIQFDSEHPSRLEAKKRFLEGTVIRTIAENIEPGDHTLTVRSGDSGFLICALVLG